MKVCICLYWVTVCGSPVQVSALSLGLLAVSLSSAQLAQVPGYTQWLQQLATHRRLELRQGTSAAPAGTEEEEPVLAHTLQRGAHTKEGLKAILIQVLKNRILEQQNQITAEEESAHQIEDDRVNDLESGSFLDKLSHIFNRNNEYNENSRLSENLSSNYLDYHSSDYATSEEAGRFIPKEDLSFSAGSSNDFSINSHDDDENIFIKNDELEKIKKETEEIITEMEKLVAVIEGIYIKLLYDNMALNCIWMSINFLFRETHHKYYNYNYWFNVES